MISIDKIGYNGKMIRDLEDEQGPNVKVIVPPKAKQDTGLFTSEQFQKSEDGAIVTCPAGHQSRSRKQTAGETREVYTFSANDCRECPLLSQCMAKPPTGRNGRSVSKKLYEAEYARVDARAKTDTYREVRQVHPAVERKFHELVNHHRARRVRYRGTAKVRLHAYITATAVNVKRLVKLLSGKLCAQAN